MAEERCDSVLRGMNRSADTAPANNKLASSTMIRAQAAVVSRNFRTFCLPDFGQPVHLQITFGSPPRGSDMA